MTELNINEKDFQKEVLESTLPVLVDFWASWCGPCRFVSPIVTAIAEESVGKLKVAKVNVDNNGELAMQYGITSIPTLMLFKNGKVAKTLVGVRSKEEILKMLD